MTFLAGAKKAESRADQPALGATDLTLDLRYFQFATAALEQGSFRRAAEVLGVPQSSVSRRVQALEDRLGIILFERHHTGVRVTAAGRVFMKDARTGINELRRAVRAVGGARAAEHGELRIGIAISLSSGFLRKLLRRYAERYPGVNMRLHLGTPEEHMARLMSGRTDVAFLTGDPAVVGCEALRLWNEGVHVALPNGHRLSARAKIGWEDIRHERFIATTGGPGPKTVDYLIKRLADLSFRPDIELHDVGRDDLMHMVAIGFGVTLTSESSLGTEFPDVVFRPIAGGLDFLPWSGVWATNNTNPALNCLLGIARRLSERCV